MFFNFDNAINARAVNCNLIKAVTKGRDPFNQDIPTIYVECTVGDHITIRYKNEELRNTDFYNFISKNS